MTLVSFLIPYKLGFVAPKAKKVVNNALGTKSAVIREIIIPMAKVVAKPFTVPEPRIYSTAAAIRVVMLPSKIADRAFSNPALMAFSTEFPAPISSLIRVKIITLASTAIPMDRIIPAIPGKVRVTSKACISTISSPTYMKRAKDAARPGIR